MSPFDPLAERQAANRIASTRRRHRPEVIAKTADYGKLYRQRPGVNERALERKRQWRAKYSTASPSTTKGT